MGKQRLGGNKSETKSKRDKGKAKKRTMAMEKESARSKEKAKILATSMPSRGNYEAALTADTHVLVGRAIVLAHGAGGSASHASMKAWKKRLGPYCDDVFLFNFPRPYQMAGLTNAFAEAVAQARTAGHKRLVLAGVGMGARAALHLLGALPGDEGEEVEQLPPPLREAVVGTLALGYPLRRAGYDELRDAAIRRQPADAPPLLLLSGSADPLLDRPALEAAVVACAAPAELLVVEGGDQGLSIKSATQLDREAAQEADEALAAFLERTLGSAEDHSKRKKIKAAKPTKPTKPQGTGGEGERTASEGEAVADGHGAGAAVSAVSLDLSLVPDVELSGCGSAEVRAVP